MYALVLEGRNHPCHHLETHSLSDSRHCLASFGTCMINLPLGISHTRDSSMAVEVAALGISLDQPFFEPCRLCFNDLFPRPKSTVVYVVNIYLGSYLQSVIHGFSKKYR